MEKRSGFLLHIILALIILLNILDFFELLDPFWDYVKKIVSWFLVGLLFYRLSPTNVLLGVRKRALDFWYVVAAFSLTINDMIQYAVVMRENMLARAGEYIMFFKGTGVAVTVIEVSEGIWNALTLQGLNPENYPEIMQHGVEIASQLSMNNQIVPVAMSFGGKEAVYEVLPQGLNGSLLSIYNSLFVISDQITLWGLLLGMVGLLIWSLLALRVPIGAQSLMGLFDSGPVRSATRFITRFVLLFGVSVFFFLFVFSLVMEWLAIAIDAPILMFAILASVFLILIRHEHFSLASWEEWVLHVGAEYVEPFVKLFTQKRTVLLGLTGLLVLHVLTEIMNYLLPFILPLRDQLYLTQLGPGHENIFSLAVAGFSGVMTQDASVLLIAALNAIAWFGLLVLPGYIWYKIFQLRSEDHPKNHPRFSPFVLGLFSAALFTLLLAPMIWFRKLVGSGLVGVDFFTRSYGEVSSLNPLFIVLGALGVFVIIFFCAQFSWRRFLYVIPLLSSVVFMGFYAYYFFLSSFTYYLNAGWFMLLGGNVGLGLTFLLFMLFSAVFYASGYLLFVYEIIRE